MLVFLAEPDPYIAVPDVALILRAIGTGARGRNVQYGMPKLGNGRGTVLDRLVAAQQDLGLVADGHSFDQQTCLHECNGTHVVPDIQDVNNWNPSVHALADQPLHRWNL